MINIFTWVYNTQLEVGEIIQPTFSQKLLFYRLKVQQQTLLMERMEWLAGLCSGAISWMNEALHSLRAVESPGGDWTAQSCQPGDIHSPTGGSVWATMLLWLKLES